MFPLCMLTNLCMAWVAQSHPPYRLYHSFHLPNLRIEDASRHIHTLERLKTMHFEIRNTTRPVRLGDFVCVGAECMVMGKPQSIRMFTRNVLESTVLCLNDKGEQAVTYKLRLRPSQNGSIVCLNTTIYKTPRWIHRLSESVFAFFLMYKTAPCAYDGNLILYRRMILRS